MVARDLIGKYLVRKRGGKETALMITEVEAYDGPKDKASHASRGMTERNKIMFARGGYFYVYLCYGMYEMLNFVTGPEGYPAAILVRGGCDISPPTNGGPREVEGGLPAGRQGLRGVLDGPGKLTKFLNINRDINCKKIEKATGLWVEDRGIKINPRYIKRLPRVGVDYAGEVWKNKLYRFRYQTANKK